ncbi:hypothetical protein LINGRAHAP2_LOCUS20630 [Linum grandiflorum]
MASKVAILLLFSLVAPFFITGSFGVRLPIASTDHNTMAFVTDNLQAENVSSPPMPSDSNINDEIDCHNDGKSGKNKDKKNKAKKDKDRKVADGPGAHN